MERKCMYKITAPKPRIGATRRPLQRQAKKLAYYALLSLYYSKCLLLVYSLRSNRHLSMEVQQLYINTKVNN